MTRKLDEDRYTEIFNDGVDAYSEGWDINSSPWPMMSREYEAWQAGWMEALHRDYYA